MKNVSLLAALTLLCTGLLTGCGNDPTWTVKAVPAAGLQSAFTTNCQAISNDDWFFNGTLTPSRLVSITAGPSSTIKVTFHCVDANNKVTGTTTLTSSNMNMTASSSEGSTETASYAAKPGIITSGVFPIIK